MIHQHSAQAYREEELKLSKRALVILGWLRANGSHTDREVMRGLGFTDPNAVRPRITELVACGLLEECDAVECNVTHKTVRVVRAKDMPPVQVELAM